MTALPADPRDLGPTTDVVTAGAYFGIGESLARQLARAGEFPCTVIRLGRRYVVPTHGLARALELPEEAS